MDLSEALSGYREKIVARWVEYTLQTYSSSKFFQQERDKFANPTGANVRKSLEELYSLLVRTDEPVDFKGPVTDFIRLRAVQEFTPSQAVAPLTGIKHIVRELLGKDKKCSHLLSELYDFEFAVDLLVLAAFDVYMESRERLYQVRIEEIRSGSTVLTDAKCPSKITAEGTQQVINTVKKSH